MGLHAAVAPGLRDVRGNRVVVLLGVFPVATSEAQKTILVCDDDQDILDAVSMALVNAGYKVVTAHEHKELTNQIRLSPPDLIILDVRMPERDGFWIAEFLQVLGVNVPIMFMTAYDQMVYRLYAPFVGAVEYLIKPVDMQILLKKVERALAPVHS